MKEDLMWSASPSLSDVRVPSSFMDWTFYASYVNNFNFSADTTYCDGKSKSFFNTGFATGQMMGKNDRVIELLEPWSYPRVDPPFLVLITGDMGREKMLVTHIHYTKQFVEDNSRNIDSNGNVLKYGDVGYSISFKEIEVATHLNLTRGILAGNFGRKINFQQERPTFYP
jgi:hypothetical protein